MSWTCANCGREEDDSIECVINRTTGTCRHLSCVTSPVSTEDKRQEAERSRRGIEVLKQKSEKHGAQVCTISGKPPDPDYAALGSAPQPVKANGQHADYYVLCPEERAKGFVRPVRSTYRHIKCGTETSMGLALAETYARDPHFYGATFCCCCGTHFPLFINGEAQFYWVQNGNTQEAVGA